MIRYEEAQDLVRITIDRDAPGNKLTLQMMLDFIASLEKAHASGARFLVIDSAQPDFTMGRDQSEKVSLPRAKNLSLILRANKLLRHFPGISVSLIRGRALGFGSGIALHSTVAIAEETASFGFDEVEHGLAPLIVIAYLPYFIGPKAARELCVTGRRVNARDAISLGMINRIVPEGGLAHALAALREEMTPLHPGAVKLIRAFSERSIPYPSDEVLAQAVQELAGWIEAGRPV